MMEDMIPIDEYVRAIELFLDTVDNDGSSTYRKKLSEDQFRVGCDPDGWFTLPIRYWDKFSFCHEEKK